MLYACSVDVMGGLSMKQDKLPLATGSVAVRNDCDDLMPDDPVRSLIELFAAKTLGGFFMELGVLDFPDAF